MAVSDKMAPPNRKPIHYPNPLTLKVDEDTDSELSLMALYERKKKGAFIRDNLVDIVQRYRRNPQYLKWKRQYDASQPQSPGGAVVTG